MYKAIFFISSAIHFIHLIKKETGKYPVPFDLGFMDTYDS